MKYGPIFLYDGYNGHNGIIIRYIPKCNLGIWEKIINFSWFIQLWYHDV